MRRARRRATRATASGGRSTACSRRGRSEIVIRGVIFDLDGVIADTEPLQWQAYRRVLAELGVDVGLEEYRRAWIATGTGPEYAQQKYGLAITPDEIKTRKAKVYLELVHAGVSPCRGAPEALARLSKTHRVGLATNTARAEVEL